MGHTMVRVKGFITHQLKRIWIYFKKFWKAMAITMAVIILVIASKFVPHMFADFSPPPVTVAAQLAVEEKWHKELPSIGTLQAVQAVTIAPEVEGRITAIHFQPGQTVKAGDPIIQLNDASEQADLKRYEAQLAYSKATVDRSKKLIKSSFESQADLDQKSATESQNEAQVLQAKAVIDKKNVRAPFDGVLGIRQVNLGQYLQSGTTVVTLTNAKKLFVNFTRPERDKDVISVGQEVRIKVDAFPDKEFEAIITTIEPQISSETRNIKIQATMDNEDLLLAPGMFADLKVILPVESSVIAIPETAVDFSLYGNAVYVVTKDGKDKHGQDKTIVKRHYVTIGDRKNGKIAILKGIKAGDLVVTSGQLKIDDGSNVVVDPKAQLTPPAKLTAY